MFQSTKWSCPNGGWMNHPMRSTTWPSRTFTSPTEQALAAEPLAVSKSMAVKSSGTCSTLARGSDTERPRLAAQRRYCLTLVALTIGIVGLPNVGKSTLFNALTKNDVLAANYPFATIEPNVGVVNLPDARLDMLARDLRQRAHRARDGVASSTSPAS